MSGPPAGFLYCVVMVVEPTARAKDCGMAGLATSGVRSAHGSIVPLGLVSLLSSLDQGFHPWLLTVAPPELQGGRVATLWREYNEPSAIRAEETRRQNEQSVVPRPRGCHDQVSSSAV